LIWQQQRLLVLAWTWFLTVRLYHVTPARTLSPGLALTAHGLAASAQTNNWYINTITLNKSLPQFIYLLSGFTYEPRIKLFLTLLPYEVKTLLLINLQNYTLL